LQAHGIINETLDIEDFFKACHYLDRMLDFELLSATGWKATARKHAIAAAE
jgi:hypothetical protein